MTLLIAYAALAIGISFLCSMLEASLLSLPRGHIEVLIERGSPFGKILLGMKDEIDRPLAAILTFNTVAHTVGAAGVGAQAAVVFGSGAVGVASTVMTVLILVVSEIIPKTLGVVYAKRLSGVTALITRFMTIVCMPLVVMLERLHGLLGHEREKEQISRAELVATIRLGRTGGALRRREYHVVSNLLALGGVRLKEILTPRTVIFSLPRETKVGEATSKHEPIRFARIPVYEGSPESVTGYVTRFDIHQAHVAGEEERALSEFQNPVTFLPEQATVSDALDHMLTRKEHIAMVVDEYGGLAGLVTLEDALETLLGTEIVDETDAVVDMRELAKRLRQRRGMQPGGK